MFNYLLTICCNINRYYKKKNINSIINNEINNIKYTLKLLTNINNIIIINNNDF